MTVGTVTAVNQINVKRMPLLIPRSHGFILTGVIAIIRQSFRDVTHLVAHSFATWCKLLSWVWVRAPTVSVQRMSTRP